MNVQRDPESILNAWLDEGPTDLPDATRRAILTSLPATTQARRGLLAPRRFGTMTPSSRIAIAALLTAAAIGGSIYLFGSRNAVNPTATQTPTTTTAESTAATSSLDGYANNFPEPFRYRLPAGSGYVASRSGAGFYQFRVPVPGTANFTHGVIVRPVVGGRDDPCNESSAVAGFASGAQSVMDYLATVPTTSLSAAQSITLDGRPALQAVLHVGESTPACTDVWLWDGQGSISQNGGRNADWEIRVVDVAGTLIAIYGEVDPTWQSVSDALIASFHFDTPPASPSGS